MNTSVPTRPIGIVVFPGADALDITGPYEVFAFANIIIQKEGISQELVYPVTLLAEKPKVGRFKAEYKGQMELYLCWLAKHEQEPDENPPLGIILFADKKQEQVELLEMDKSGIHVAEYLTVLPLQSVLVVLVKTLITKQREVIFH